MGAAPPEAHRQDGESAPTAAGVAAPRQSQPREAYGARAASNTGKTVGGRARAGRRAAAFPGGGASRRRGACRGAEVTYHSITRMAAYQGKSFEELRWEHYSEDHTLEAQPPAEPPAAAQPAPPTQPPSPTALVAAARARLDASELQEDRGSKRDVLARTPPSATAPERPPPPADARKRPATRGGACLEAALARAAPAAEPEVQPITADNYAAAALAAAANPHPPPA